MDPENGQSTATENQESSAENQSNEASEALLSQDPGTGEQIEQSQQSQQSQEGKPAEPISDILNAFREELGRPPLEKEKKPGEPDKAPETEGEAKEGEASNEETEEAPVVKPQQKQSGRKYDGLTTEEAEWFKHMGNAAYNSLYPKFVEMKKVKEENEVLRSSKENSFYSHSEAYKLDPTFNKLQSASQRLEAEFAYWQEQLANVDDGGDFIPASYNPESGEYVYGEPIKGSSAVRAHIIASMTKANGISGQLNNQLQTFQGDFKAKHDDYQQSLTAARNKVLGGLSENEQGILAKKAEGKLQLWPPYMRNNTEVRTLAELLVINEGLVKYIQNLKNEVSNKKIINRTVKANGPVSGSSATGEKKFSPNSVLKEFAEAGFTHGR